MTFSKLNNKKIKKKKLKSLENNDRNKSPFIIKYFKLKNDNENSQESLDEDGLLVMTFVFCSTCWTQKIPITMVRQDSPLPKPATIFKFGIQHEGVFQVIQINESSSKLPNYIFQMFVL